MKILYICTHNRCRSVLCEAITNYRAAGVVTARSAGSQPAGEVHPLTLHYLDEASVPTAGLCSQSWDDFATWQPDVVITVCDRAARESCPVYLGASLRVHWGLTDPSAREGDADEVARAFRETIRVIERRVQGLVEVAGMPRQRWQQALHELVSKEAAAGAVPGAAPSSMAPGSDPGA